MTNSYWKWNVYLESNNRGIVLLIISGTCFSTCHCIHQIYTVLDTRLILTFCMFSPFLFLFVHSNTTILQELVDIVTYWDDLFLY